MNVKDLMKNAGHLRDYEFERRLNKLVRENYRYRNLNESNKKIILDLMKKYKSHLRKGIGMSYYAYRDEIYKLSRNKIKLGLSDHDLKDIREILSMFRMK